MILEEKKLNRRCCNLSRVFVGRGCGDESKELNIDQTTKHLYWQRITAEPLTSILIDISTLSTCKQQGYKAYFGYTALGFSSNRKFSKINK